MPAAPALTHEYILSKLDDLPTLPTIVYELSRVINDPMSSTSDVERIMSNDPSLTTKVLRLANSSYYAIPGGVTSVSRAVAYLGFDTVNQLVLATSMLEVLAVKGPQRFDLNEFWKHSIGVAIAAETLGHQLNHPLTSDLFTGGLIHDIGKIALYTIDAESMLKIASLAHEKNLTYSEAETELGFISHSRIGHMLTQKWGLPSSLQATVKHHHSKDLRERASLTVEINRNVDIVYLANLFTHALKFGHSGHSKILGAPKDVMDRVGLKAQDFKNILLEIKSSLDRAADLMRVLSGSDT